MTLRHWRTLMALKMRRADDDTYQAWIVLALFLFVVLVLWLMTA